MALFKCKMCGGSVEMDAEKTFGTCEYCGCTMTFPKTDDEQRAAAFNRGNHFRRIGEFDKALAVYERIVREDETDAEAHWCCALSRFGIEYVEDPGTYEWLPTCHRASFDSFLEDVDYLAAVEHSEGITRRQYQKDAARIAEVQRGILATSQNAEPYDVFICYKESDENGDRTRDSLMAQEVYYQLTEQGYRVFFARITLEDVVGSQYEPYIFAALNSAKVMVVIGTKPEYLNAVWVKNEWSRFLAMMKQNRQKLLLPCYKDMDPYDLPEQLSVLQSYDMSKIGFIQDLTRGIKKVLDAEKKPEAVHETVVVQQVGNTNISALLKRGTMALEDREWDKASDFFEDVLNQDPECGQAYLGQFLAQQKLLNLAVVAENRLKRVETARDEKIPVEMSEEKRLDVENHAREMATQYEIPGFLLATKIMARYNVKQMHYLSQYSARVQQLEAEKAFWNENRLLMRAMQFSDEVKSQISQASGKVIHFLVEAVDRAKQLDDQMKYDAETQFAVAIEAADRLVQEEHAAALTAREEAVGKRYQEAVRAMKAATCASDYRIAKSKFVQMAGYKDSEELAHHCREKELECEALKNKIDNLKNEMDLLMLERKNLAFYQIRRREEIEDRLSELVSQLRELGYTGK